MNEDGITVRLETHHGASGKVVRFTLSKETSSRSFLQTLKRGYWACQDCHGPDKPLAEDAPAGLQKSLSLGTSWIHHLTQHISTCQKLGLVSLQTQLSSPRLPVGPMSPVVPSIDMIST